MPNTSLQPRATVYGLRTRLSFNVRPHKRDVSLLHHFKTMTYQPLILLLLGVLPSVACAQYRPDWNTQNFYEQLHWCRSSIVFPAAADYEKKAASTGKSTETSRAEAISIIPASEAVASASCYCAINEVAKNITYASFASDKAKIAGYLQGAKCKEVTTQVVRGMSKERANELRLK